MRTKKMYVLVREDLAPIYRMAQGAHAVADYAIRYRVPFSEWDNQTIVFLGVRNLLALKEWPEQLRIASKQFSLFREPDLEGHETAIACCDTGEIFKHLPTTR